MSRVRFAFALTVATLILFATWAALAFPDAGSNATPSAAAGSKKVIYMSAVEYKGGTNSEPFPSASPPPGGGYKLTPPDDTGRWETSTYRWEPGAVVVNKNDDVELWIWGVNGAQHPSYVEGYVPDFTVRRGTLTILSFKADKEGVFRIHCNAHQPSMESFLIVLP